MAGDAGNPRLPANAATLTTVMVVECTATEVDHGTTI